ncbi:hypothetical protein FOL47_005594 [Perkinsus chesapeaki]|uniref:DNA repair protein rad16 n=1 Tax=Perkinsus chesapeaki TaxID=330153 RepID=A0A7J6LWN9_PERCH|nr:hypothetical protein FOL47_005594 [Perkinsus chesapeaki]
MDVVPVSFDLENFLSAEHSQLKKPAPGVMWDPTTKNWIAEDMQGKLKKKQAASLQSWKFETDLAKSGLSTCRRCGHKIPKSSLRMGYPVEDPRGNLGAITIWFHAECAPFKFLEINGTLEGLVGGEGNEESAENLCCDPAEWFKSNIMGFEELADDNKECLIEVFQKRNEKKPVEELDIGGMKHMVSKLLVDKFPPPDELVIPLLPFQREGLAWMCNQELTQECRGGILADEMGMGKTIQAVALVMKRLPETKGPTLVVCPVAAVMQWYSEIHRYLRPESLKVHVYHGSNRLKGEDLLKFDVVLTTYQTMEYEYRKQLNKLKAICQYCHRAFLPDKLLWHQKYMCGPDAEKTAKQSKTHRKFREAAEAAKKTLGIPTASAAPPDSPEASNSRGKKRKAESDYKPPTMGNVLREVMAKAGMENAEKASIWKVKEYYWAKQRAKHEEIKQHEDLDESSIRRMTMRQLKEVIMDRYPGMEIPNHMRRAELVSLILEMQDDESKPSSDQVDDEGAGEQKPERLSATDIGKLKVAELRSKCRELGLDSSGLKADLVARVRMAVDNERIARMRKTAKAAPGKESAADSTEQKTTKGAKTKDYSNDTAEAEMKAEPSTSSRRRAPSRRCKVAKASPASAASAASTAAPQSSEGRRSSPIMLGSSSPDTSDLLNEAKTTLSVSDSSSSSSESSSESDAPPPPSKKRKMAAQKRRAAAVARLRQTAKPQAGRGPVAKSKANDDDEDYELSEDDGSADSDDSSSEYSQSSYSDLEVVTSKKTGRQAKDKTATRAGRITRAAARREEENAVEGEDTSDCERSDLDLSKSALHSVRWGRVILDEAHRIKGRTTTTALGAYALRAEYRWGLSGTPLQNRVGELYSLIRFLKNDPYAFYFCKSKDCNCKSMAYRFEDNRYCKRCGHTKMQHYSYFNQTISKPILKHGFAGVGKDALKELRTQVLDRLLLRRTKEERAADLHLPPMTVSIRKTKLTASEKDFYESLAMQSQLRFNVYADEGTVLNNYAHIFDLLTRLRQAVDHPYLIVHGMDCGSIPAKSAAGQDRADICVLCQDDIPARTSNEDEAQARATCGHSFHNECVRDFLREAPQLPLNGGIGCPACFAPITVTFGQAVDDDEESRQGSSPPPDVVKESPTIGGSSKRSILNRIKADEFESSAKIDALLDEVRKMKEQDPTAKGLVFSQFSRMLELVNFKLRREGISCLVLHGGIPMTQRSNILLSFRQDPEFTLLLISLKAGGEGLNLQAASSVFLLDPWWNPAYEQQAIQRAHRLGQTKPVNAVRFITQDTVEERILALQEKKQLVFDGTVGGNEQGALQKLAVEDLRFLFQHCYVIRRTLPEELNARVMLHGNVTTIPYDCHPVQLAALSSDGKYLATATKTGLSGSRVVVRSLPRYGADSRVIATIPIAFVSSSSSSLSVLSWSPDSMLLMAAHNESGVITIMSPIDQPDWRCLIEQGCTGLAAALWSPDSRHILAIGSHSLGLDIWSLTRSSASISTVAFSESGHYLAALRRRECKDFLSIHEVQDRSFKQVISFNLPTIDAQGVAWPFVKDSHVIVWDIPSARAPSSGGLLNVYSIAGEPFKVLKAPVNEPEAPAMFGLATVKVEREKSLLIAGTVNGDICIWNTDTWSLIGSCRREESMQVLKEAGGYTVYQLNERTKGGSKYKPVDSISTKIAMGSPSGVCGIRKVAVSPSGSYLAIQNEGGGMVYIWRCCQQLKLDAVLLHQCSVDDFTWKPALNGDDTLIVCLGGQLIYDWTTSQQACCGAESSSLKLPADFSASEICWHAPAHQLLVRDGKRGRVLLIMQEDKSRLHGG